MKEMCQERTCVKPEVVADDARAEVSKATMITGGVLCLCVGIWAFAAFGSAMVSAGGVAGLAKSFGVAIGLI